MSMKMARASNADIEAALDVSRILDELERGEMPSDRSATEFDKINWFDRDNAQQCKEALGTLLDAAAKGSVFRVTFGMATVLDPRNKLLDPDADTLEAHPRIQAALSAIEPLPVAYSEASAAIATEAASLIARARQACIVLTIETQPRLPLAMGNYDIAVTTREAREGGAA